MKATELIGKTAIRVAPVKLGVNEFGVTHDYSYCSRPVEISHATEHHVFIKNPFSPINIEKTHILDRRWCDENWIEYVPPVIPQEDREDAAELGCDESD